MFVAEARQLCYRDSLFVGTGNADYQFPPKPEESHCNGQIGHPGMTEGRRVLFAEYSCGLLCSVLRVVAHL